MNGQLDNTKSIQMTLFDYFKDVERFSIGEAVECAKQAKEVKEPSVRARIYEGIDKGLFERVGKGVYTVKQVKNGRENICMLINGNGRDLSMFSDSSIDCIITDHPYKLDKSLKGGNRDFASYESFQYTQEDLNEKFRVLKDGCYLVEFLPEENGDNYKYIYEIKEMAANAGLDYYASVDWKKGEFVANTGRKAKNTENIMFFTKGKSRDLRLDAKKNKEMILNGVVLQIHKETEDFWSEENSGLKTELELFVKESEREKVDDLVNQAWVEWTTKKCENSILLDQYNQDELLQIPITEYIELYLEHEKVEFINLTGHVEKTDSIGATDKKMIDILTKSIFETAPEKLHYMSGANGMLPTEFDVAPVKKTDKIHQAEKPLELIEQIISYVTLPNEKILDQFAGSGVVGAAALETGRDSILIESDPQIFENMEERIRKSKRR